MSVDSSLHKLTLDNIQKSSFLYLTAKDPQHHKKVALTLSILKGKNTLFDAFFSTKNIKYIQQKIKDLVFEGTKGNLFMKNDQSERMLRQVMHAIYIQNAVIDVPIRTQIADFNVKVINYVMPELISELKHKMFYLDDINTPLKLLDQPVNLNAAGRLTLPSFI